MRSVVSVVFVNFLHYRPWGNRLLMNDRDSMGFLVALINSLRLVNVSLFVVNNRHFVVNYWCHMIFMMNRMFNDDWLLVIGNFTTIFFLQDRLLMRLNNFMVCSCGINFVIEGYFDRYLMMAYIVIRSAVHFYPLFT